MISISDFKAKIDAIKFGMKFEYIGECIQSYSHLATNNKGYVQIRYQGKTQFLHRVVCELFHGIPLENQQVIHSCDNRKCCNPNHLSWGYASDNTKDMMSKNRHRTVSALGSTNSQSKLVEDQVRSIKESNETGVALASKYGVSPKVISNIRLGKSWAHVE